MPYPLVGLYALLPAFVLVLFRVGAMTMTTPFFSGAALPVKIKVVLSVAITLAVFPMMLPYLPGSLTLGMAAIGLIGEVAIGAFIGLGVGMVFQAAQMAAHVIGYQSGMGLGAAYNPMLETSSTAIEQLYYFLVLSVFLAVGGDHAVIRSLLDSFATIPVLTFGTQIGSLAELLVDMMAVSLTISVRIGGPVVLALLLAFLVLGFLSRTIPQLNILTVGFPLKLGIGLAATAVTLTFLEPVLVGGLMKSFDVLREGLGLAPLN